MEIFADSPGLNIIFWVVVALAGINLILVLIGLIRRKKGPFEMHKNALGFVGKVIQEMKLVEWLNRKETTKLTIIVIIVTVFIAGFVALLDLGFFKLRDLLI